ncbi:hypothetical protein J0J30_24115, partial [Vibrio vulnificus]|nr:hypothetical protein [Vibrio vulnificus]
SQSHSISQSLSFCIINSIIDPNKEIQTFSKDIPFISYFSTSIYVNKFYKKSRINSQIKDREFQRDPLNK